MRRTISGMVGKGSLSHNNRDFLAENIDQTQTKNNITYINKDLKEVYKDLFGEALKRYNNRQKRNERKITDYYEHIRTGKQEQLFHEVIFQIGNGKDTKIGTPEAEIAKIVLSKFMKDFKKRNPYLKVFSAHLHMDETTPHLHVDFVPYTTESKRGLDIRVSMKKALAAQGFEGGSREDTEFNQWINSEKMALAQIMKQHGIEWEKLDTHNEHLSVLDFKKKKRSKEIAVLEERAIDLQNKVNDLQSQVSENYNQLKVFQNKKLKIKDVDAITVKPTLFDTNKIVVDKAEFEEIKLLAKKQFINEKKEKVLSTQNTTLLLENKNLKNENNSLKSELYDYKSIRNQLSVKKLESKIHQLQYSINNIINFVEESGLKPQLDKFLQQNEKAR